MAHLFRSCHSQHENNGIFQGPNDPSISWQTVGLGLGFRVKLLLPLHLFIELFFTCICRLRTVAALSTFSAQLDADSQTLLRPMYTKLLRLPSSYSVHVCFARLPVAVASSRRSSRQTTRTQKTKLPPTAFPLLPVVAPLSPPPKCLQTRKCAPNYTDSTLHSSYIFKPCNDLHLG